MRKEDFNTPDKYQLEKIKFSRREKQIMELIARGYSSKEIAAALGLTKRTIDYYRSLLYVKLNVKGAAALMQAAVMLQFMQNNK